MHRTPFLAALAATLGLAALAAPAHASLNDQFVCETRDARMIEVTIMATEPGTALLSQRGDSAGEPRQTVLTGAPAGRTFRFDGKGARFIGAGTLGVLFLGGERLLCRFPDEPDALSEPAAEQTLAHVMGDGEGLLLRRFDIGADVALAFGMPRGELVAALDRYLGAPEPLVFNSECGAGPMEFQRFGRLEINVQDGAFVGWTMLATGEPAQPAAISLIDGTRPGDPVDPITQGFEPVEDSTLGAEYYRDGVTALIDEPSGTVDLLMAGTNCVFR